MAFPKSRWPMSFRKAAWSPDCPTIFWSKETPCLPADCSTVSTDTLAGCPEPSLLRPQRAETEFRNQGPWNSLADLCTMCVIPEQLSEERERAWEEEGAINQSFVFSSRVCLCVSILSLSSHTPRDSYQQPHLR